MMKIKYDYETILSEEYGICQIHKSTTTLTELHIGPFFVMRAAVHLEKSDYESV